MLADLPNVIQDRVRTMESADLCHRIVALYKANAEQPYWSRISVYGKHEITKSAPNRRFVALSAFAAYVAKRIIYTKGILSPVAVHILEAIRVDDGAFPASTSNRR